MRCDRNDQFINNFGLNPVNCVVTEFGQSVVSEQLLKIRKNATVEYVELFVCIGYRRVFLERDVDALNGFEICHGHTEVAPSDGGSVIWASIHSLSRKLVLSQHSLTN